VAANFTFLIAIKTCKIVTTGNYYIVSCWLIAPVTTSMEFYLIFYSLLDQSKLLFYASKHNCIIWLGGLFDMNLKSTKIILV